jgi:acyl-CoA synthetase (AMP-forming)/AMP-acid ligase II
VTPRDHYSGLQIGLGHTLPGVIAHVAERWGDKPFSINEDGMVTSFAALKQRVAGLGAPLLDLGVVRGDRIAILAPNSTAWAVAGCAAESIGAIMVPINTRFKGPEIRYVLERARVAVLFTVGDFLGTDYAAMVVEAGGGPGADGRPAAGLPQLRALIRLDDPGFAPATFDDRMRARFQAAASQVTPATTADLMFTSGTTGAPKGAMHGHGQALWMTGLWNSSNDLCSDDRTAVVNPFFHSFGYRSGWVSALTAGMTMWPLSAFDAGALLALIERERITQLSGTPTMFFSLMNHPDFGKRDISSLRSGHTGGAKTPPDIIRAGYETLGFDIFLTSYGQTEATAMISTNYPGDPLEAIVSTVGRPIPDTEVRIVSPEGGDVAEGQQGELLIRGPTVIVGGFNAYPVEIEIMIASHPDIAEIAIIGVPDDRMGEVTAACIIPQPGAEITLPALTAWCRERMANYKVPRHLFVMADMPRTPLGKVQKFELRQYALEQFQAV